MPTLPSTPPDAGALLTGSERRAIAEARQLAALHGADAIGPHVGETNPDLIYPVAFGQAAWLLAELCAITDRLTAGIEATA